MNRRRFLAGVAGAVSLGALGSRVGSGADPPVVRVWFTPAAAEHDGLAERIEGYLGRALERAVGGAQLSFADRPVAMASEGGKATLGFRWPRLVVAGATGVGAVDPVGGVNLLVTDGDPTADPAGYARPHVAAVTGAEAIAAMPPAAETQTVVPYSVPAVATQLLLHECGHALGIGHDHGSAVRRDGVVVASPMVASYLWKSESVREKQLDDGNACGASYPDADAAVDRRLRLTYADCASRAIQGPSDD